jgi:hypothetical protein
MFKNRFSVQSCRQIVNRLNVLRCGCKKWLFWFCEGLVFVSGKTKCAICGQVKNFKIFRAVGKKLKHEAVGCCVGKRSAPKSIFISFVLMS